MQIVEIKNNLLKISYDADVNALVLSGFLAIKCKNRFYIGQIMYLEGDANNNFAILKLLFNFDEAGNVSSYNGSVPNKQSEILQLSTQEIFNLLSVKSPISIGQLSLQPENLNLDENLLREKLLICAEKNEDKKILTENLAYQLSKKDKNVLIIDLTGEIELPSKKLIAGEDFKLPLNYDTINFLYEKGLDDAKAESKAIIQEVFQEVQNYINTIPDKFLPLDIFKSVVDEQYQETEMVELVLLKNKLIKYGEKGLFAQTKEEFISLEKSLKNNKITVLDCSSIESVFQREFISFAYSAVANLNEDVFVFVEVRDKNSDKKLLKQIYTTKNAFSSIIATYAYKYNFELKQISKNLILFAPIKQQNDFASYNTFIHKLNENEFVVCGKETHNLPFIVRLEKIEIMQKETQQEIFPNEIAVEEEFEKKIQEEKTPEELLEEQIRQDVEQFYTRPSSDIESEKQHEEPVVVEELTEEDLDFIDQMNIVQDSTDEPSEEVVQVQPQDDFVYSSGEETSSEQESAEEDFIVEEFSEEQDSSLVFPSETNEFQFEETFESVESSSEILPPEETTRPTLPVFEAEIPPKEDASSDEFESGDLVMHNKYGKGTIEKKIGYGSKNLYSINFENVGRRLLDPNLTELQKI